MRFLKLLSLSQYFLPSRWLKRLSKTQRNYVHMAVGAILVLLIPMAIATFRTPPQASAAWMDDSWGYRQRVDISNAGTVQTDFQVSFTLDTNTLYDNGKLQSDCDDIRITDTNGKLLPYWIETMATACGDSNSAQTIWVKAPTVTAASSGVTTTLYVYYGNPSASIYSDGNKVFTFFDDFSGSSINTAKWTVTDSTGWSVGSGVLTGTNTTGRLTSIQTFTTATQPFLMATRHDVNTFAGNGHETLGTYVSTSNTFGGFLPHADTSGFYRNDAGWTNFNPAPVTFSSYHIAKVYGASSTTMYNSMEQSGNTYTTAALTNTVSAEPIALGKRYDDCCTGQAYNATWDWIYVRKFAATEPTTSVDATVDKALTPVAYWKFDEGNGATAQDSTQNNSDGTITGAIWKPESECVSGKCIYFDGTGDYVRASDPSNGSLDFASSAFTLSAWIKHNGTAISRGILAKDARTDGNRGYMFHIQSDNTLRFMITSTGNTANYHTTTTTGTVSANDWHYVTAVFVPSTSVTIYIDGVQSTQNTTSIPTGAFNNTGAFDIGTSNTGDLFTGFIDEPKVYNQALTATQIKANYIARSSAEGTSSVLGTDTKGQNLSNGLVGHWKMDEAAANTCTGGVNDACDSSGNANNGAWGATTSQPTVATGKFGNGLDFDAGDEVQVADSSSLDITGPITISAWVKNDQTGATLDGGIVWKSAPLFGTNLEKTYELGFLDGTLYFQVGDGVTNVTNNASYSWSGSGTWKHILGVWDGTTNTNGMKIFVDGVQVAQGTSSISSIRATTDPLYIGGKSAGQVYEKFDGGIDEARVYNRALSPNEISQLYNFASGPVVHYKFDEGSGTSSTTDSSGNANTGTMNGTMTSSDWVPGKYGKALDFDGTDDYVTTPTFSFIGSATAEFTVSGWINPRVAAGTIFHNCGPGCGWSTRLVGFVSGKLNGYVHSSSFSDTGSVTLNTWTYVTITRDSSNNNKLYKNGVLVASSNAAYSASGGANEIGIGRHRADCCQSDSPGWFNGGIDDVKVYNYSRTAKQIVEDMNAGHPAVGSPVGSAVGHWKFDEGADNTCSGAVKDTCNSGSESSTLDGTGNGFSTPATATSGWTQSGKFGKGLIFDGTGDYVEVTSTAAISMEDQDFSVSFWIKYGAGNAQPDRLVEKIGSTGRWTVGYYAGDKVFYQSYNGTSWDAGAIGTTALGTTNWHHVAVTKSGTTSRVYIDGNLDGTDTASHSDINDTGGQLRIGCESSGGNCVNATMDEVKIYRGALTASEVKIDMNQGKSLVLGASGTTSTGTPDNSQDREYCVPGDSTTCTAPTGEWTFENRGGTTTYDSSGNGNTATLVNAQTSTVGKVGKAVTGTSNNIRMTQSATAVNSISFWAYRDSAATIMYLFDDRNTADADVKAYLYWNTDGTLTNNLSTTIYVDGKVATSATANAWHHFVVTGMTMDTSGTLHIGENWAGAFVFNGKFDQIRTFARVLTPAQVAWDYNRGAPVGLWRFDECQGTTAYDDSRNGNNASNGLNGTITPGTTYTSAGTCNTSPSTTMWGAGATGKRNASLGFDGTTTTNVSIADNTRLRMGTSDWTTSAWVKTTAATNQQIIDKRNAGPTVRYYTQVNSNGTVNVELRSTSAPDVATTLTSTRTVNDGSWHLLTATYDRDGNLTLYIDGVQESSGSISSMNGVDINGSSELEFGGTALNGGNPFTGQIDDARIYNYALTANQIKTLYNGFSVFYGPNAGQP